MPSPGQILRETVLPSLCLLIRCLPLMSHFKRSGDSVEAFDESFSVDQAFQLTTSVLLEATVAVHPMISFKTCHFARLAAFCSGGLQRTCSRGAQRG
jgi:hypothetical protein